MAGHKTAKGAFSPPTGLENITQGDARNLIKRIVQGKKSVPEMYCLLI